MDPYPKPIDSRWSVLFQSDTFWFWLTTVLFGIHLFTSGIHQQVYDANGYWDLTYKLYNNGDFSLYNFDSALRGYLFPLLHVPMVVLAQLVPWLSADVLIKLLGAGMAGGLAGVWLPRLWALLSQQPVAPLRRLLLIGFIFVLWRDYFNYSLTDFPVLVMEVGVLLLVLRRITPARMFVVGLLSAALINVRPVYQVVIPVLALLILWLSTDGLRTWSWRTLGVLAGVFVLGFAVVTLPQWLINRENFSSSRLLVIGIDFNDQEMAAKGDLYLQKLGEGLKLQKYETNIGTDHTTPVVGYVELTGAALLATDFNHSIDSYADYIKLIVEHPLDMATLWFRHLFNGLDVQYSTPYIRYVYSNSVRLAWLNYTVIFAALAVAFRHLGRLRVLHWLLLVVLLAPVVFSIPLGMECRYVLPLHLVLATVACYGWPAAWSWQGLKGHRLSVALAYLGFLLICFSLSGYTQMLIYQNPKLLMR